MGSVFGFWIGWVDTVGVVMNGSFSMMVMGVDVGGVGFGFVLGVGI